MSAFIKHQNVFAKHRQFFLDLPDIAEQAAVLSLNDVTSRSGLKMAREETRKQIDFPPGYLEGERLRAGRRATKSTLEASMVGRDRATSLARFTKGQTPQNTRGKGVTVQVKKGQYKVLRKAFLVDLKNGNRGLAVRLKPGDALRNSDKAVRLADNVFLLYGPSVDQVLKGVADDIAPRLGDDLSKQFLRQIARLTRG